MKANATGHTAPHNPAPIDPPKSMARALAKVVALSVLTAELRAAVAPSPIIDEKLTRMGELLDQLDAELSQALGLRATRTLPSIEKLLLQQQVRQ